eukprot:UN21416
MVLVNFGCFSSILVVLNQPKWFWLTLDDFGSIEVCLFECPTGGGMSFAILQYYTLYPKISPQMKNQAKIIILQYYKVKKITILQYYKAKNRDITILH